MLEFVRDQELFVRGHDSIEIARDKGEGEVSGQTRVDETRGKEAGRCLQGPLLKFKLTLPAAVKELAARGEMEPSIFQWQRQNKIF